MLFVRFRRVLRLRQCLLNALWQSLVRRSPYGNLTDIGFIQAARIGAAYN